MEDLTASNKYEVTIVIAATREECSSLNICFKSLYLLGLYHVGPIVISLTTNFWMYLFFICCYIKFMKCSLVVSYLNKNFHPVHLRKHIYFEQLSSSCTHTPVTVIPTIARRKILICLTANPIDLTTKDDGRNGQAQSWIPGDCLPLTELSRTTRLIWLSAVIKS